MGETCRPRPGEIREATTLSSWSGRATFTLKFTGAAALVNTGGIGSPTGRADPAIACSTKAKVLGVAGDFSTLAGQV